LFTVSSDNEKEQRSKIMDSNYEAQKQFTRQRLASRREQAAAERLLREGRPARMSVLKQFLVTLFRRPGSREERKRAQRSPSGALATIGKGKR
jgi:hypothetical protein